eukprot:gb/GECH01000831.1/.p1 GENE.gb/GECH01000831.1/~~gb/GECH01000831.1/.p1  ORF type:complete len:184 (+),score=16.34 gb/GECH01000831.1/:1-552(+)
MFSFNMLKITIVLVFLQLIFVVGGNVIWHSTGDQQSQSITIDIPYDGLWRVECNRGVTNLKIVSEYSSLIAFDCKEGICNIPLNSERYKRLNFYFVASISSIPAHCNSTLQKRDDEQGKVSKQDSSDSDDGRIPSQTLIIILSSIAGAICLPLFIILGIILTCVTCFAQTLTDLICCPLCFVS